MKELPHTHSCFVCGESNPLGLKMRFQTDGRIVSARFRPCAEHIGFKGVVHGGITATVLDEIMVWACAVATRKFAYCGEMNVRYLAPIAPGNVTIVTAELVTNRKGRIFDAKSAVTDLSGKILAEATGKYLPMKDAEARQMMTEFTGDTTWLKELNSDAEVL